jgi:hypothetical protein
MGQERPIYDGRAMSAFPPKATKSLRRLWGNFGVLHGVNFRRTQLPLDRLAIALRFLSSTLIMAAASSANKVLVTPLRFDLATST